MEREFGAEIVLTFGARLKRVYESDDLGLTEQMLACLEQLAHAETQVRPQSQPQQSGDDGSEGQQNGFSGHFPLPTS
jgi:hypothetical protein